MKHRLKMFLREAWARLLFHTGLYVWVSKWMPRRLTILAGHCVEHPDNAFLPAEMRISAERLGAILDWLTRRFELVNVDQGWRRLAEGEGRSMVALSMDDGYRDNLEVLLPMLRERGISATIYLESRPLTERRVNWTHLFFWILRQISPAELVERYAALCDDDAARRRLSEALAAGGDLVYTLKKVLKYEADQRDCEATLSRIFAELGGDERALCEELYLSPDDARALRDGGVDLGGHTVHHWVLSGLEASEQERELAEGRAALLELLEVPVPSFAYPFGRRWDWDAESVEAARRAGFTTASTTHAGTNTSRSCPQRLARWMIDEATPLHLLAAEACGGFELLRRFGLDLSE